jgi:large subunit ribosomal protein L10
VVLKLDGKKAIVAEVATHAQQAASLFTAEYSGMTVSQLTELRKTARAEGMYLRVVRNTLARRALEGTKFEAMQDTLVGPLILAFSGDDPGAAARLIQAYVKKCEKLRVKAMSLGGEALPATALAQVASMPTHSGAIAQLLGMLNAPITQFVRTLAEPHAKLVRAFAAVADQKKSAS